MRIGHVAHYLGISRSTLNRLREQKLFPPPRKQIGKLKLWHVDDVDRWFGDADLQARVAAVRGKERVR
jgi:predicted DNA-binding transcriptional regulator AlpA